jgi:hypothetical protein
LEPLRPDFLQRLEVGRDKKIFESAYVSQVFER